jgi:hypothetical protein
VRVPGDARHRRCPRRQCRPRREGSEEVCCSRIHDGSEHGQSVALGAYCFEICPEAPRTGEISPAGQAVCRPRLPRSETPRHKTRPTGRFAQR